MNELTRLSRIIMEEVAPLRPSVEALRSRSRRRHLRHGAATVCAVALAVIVVVGAVQLQGGPSGPSVGTTRLASYYEVAVNIPMTVLEEVGLPSSVAIPTTVTPSLSTVSTNGVVSYVGAEYCPYCALQRWVLLVALSKFGTFTHLDNAIYSSSSDVYPHLASWSFVGATYRSKYFSFDPTELTSTTRESGGPGGYARLERLSGPQRAAFDKYDPQGTLPFVDIGNRYVTLGASASPAVLDGLSLSEIGEDLDRPNSAVARAVDGSANYLIAGMCTMVLKDAPAMCNSDVTRTARRAIATGQSPSAGTVNSTTYPTQPPTNASALLWRQWSVAEHRFWLHAAATYRPSNPACTVLKVFVTGRKLVKPFTGIPAGVWLWGMSLVGKCPRGDQDGLVKRAR